MTHCRASFVHTASMVAVLHLLDAVSTGDDGETVFVQQQSQPFHDKKQVALHQPNGDLCPFRFGSTK